MSKAEILGELASLDPGDRREILNRIWEMEEADLLSGALPDAGEKAMLDQELKEFRANPTAGADWKEVQPRLRGRFGL